MKQGEEEGMKRCVEKDRRDIDLKWIDRVGETEQQAIKPTGIVLI